MSKAKIIFLMIAIVVVIFIVFSANQFITTLDDTLFISVEKQLEDSANHSAVVIGNSFNEHINSLNVAANYLATMDDLHGKEAMDFLKIMQSNMKYRRMAVTLPNGLSLSTANTGGDLSKNDFFEEWLSGNNSIIGPLPAIDDPNENVIFMTVPIFKNGKIIGALSATYSTKELESLFDVSFLNEEGFSFLITADGEIVSGISKRSNMNSGAISLEEFAQNAEYANETLELIEDMPIKRGYGRYVDDTTDYAGYFYYCPSGISDWLVVTMVPETVMDSQVIAIGHIALNFILIILLCVLFLVSTIVYIQVKAKNQAKLSENSYRALAKHTDKILFEWDFATNKITSFSNYEDLYGSKIVEVAGETDKNFTESIYPEDAGIVAKIFENTKKGLSIKDEKFRVTDKEGMPHWCSLSATVIKDKKGRPIKAVGTLSDIDEREREIEALKESTRYDYLTGLLNKTCTQYEIEELIKHSKPNTMHAIVSLDIDNFKTINDTGGHLFGDDVLKFYAQTIKSNFRSTDIVGRFGGDEFTVLIVNIPDEAFAINKLKKLIKCCRKKYTIENKKYTTTISAGIAYYPKNGTKYKELYENADGALYHSKNTAKGTYTVYGE